MMTRLMQIGDYDKIRQLWTETEGVGLRSLDDSQAGIEKFLLRNPATCFVAEAKKQLIGTIMCGHDGRRGYIYHTTVKQDCRKKGVGKELVLATLAALKKEQIHKVALIAYSTNVSGNSFWESIGFEKRNDLVYRNLSLNEMNN